MTASKTPRQPRMPVFAINGRRRNGQTGAAWWRGTSWTTLDRQLCWGRLDCASGIRDFSTSRVAASRMSCPNKVQKITADGVGAVLPHLSVDQSPGREPVLVAGWPQRPPPRKASEAAHWSGVFGKPHAG